MATTFYSVYFDLSTNQLQLVRSNVHPSTIYSPTLRPSVHLSGDLQEETVIMEETVRIGEAYDYEQNRSDLYNQSNYEENLELEERLGRVDSRLSEKTIMGNLKITSYETSSKRMDEADICVICQGEFEKDEFIGGLQCRHEYHVECIKRWLQQHNTCPICKADAVSPNSNKF